MNDICIIFNTTPDNIFDFINLFEPINENLIPTDEYEFIKRINNSEKINQNAKESFNNKFSKRYYSNDRFRKIVDGCSFIFTENEYIGAYENIDKTVIEDNDYIIFNMYPIQNSNAIFNYPDYILINILLEQFTLNDLIDLDTSTINKKHRTRLLYIFSHPSFILKYPVIYKKWLLLRNIKCEDLKMMPNIINSNSNQYDKSMVTYCINNGDTIKRLDVSQISMFGEDSDEIVKNCKNLTHFTFNSLKYFPYGNDW